MFTVNNYSCLEDTALEISPFLHYGIFIPCFKRKSEHKLLHMTHGTIN